ncbi:MAG TPA: hypothetical protein VHD33_03150 [Legionellaceae bacterium]|nr:hypothetical protein [Legionellaceae bacterium]
MPQHLPEIHYLWVGPPTSDNFLALPGHDIAGPICMSKELQQSYYTEKNTIKFWCLDIYCDYFKQTFQNAHAIIEVCAIESLLNTNEYDANILFANLAQITQDKAVKTDVIIDFKDRFSLFLLLKQPGYFFDTNVFPKKGCRVHLPRLSKFTTAQSGFTAFNDFYFMYAPCEYSLELYSVFVRRLGMPYFNATRAFEGLSITRLNHEDCGVQKISYRSYIPSKIPGFFRLLTLQTFEHFKEHCQYTDINRQENCLFSKQLLVDCSICWINKTLSHEEIRTLSIPTDFAYIASFRSKNDFFGNRTLIEPCVYFYSKKNDAIILLSNAEKNISTLYNKVFQITNNHDGTLQIRKGTVEDSDYIIDFFSNKHPTAHPPMLMNIKGGTLLHHAILCHDREKVTWLIHLHAQLDLKATYRVLPSESPTDVEYTPLELATVLKQEDMIVLLQRSSHASQGTFFYKGGIDEQDNACESVAIIEYGKKGAM